MNIQHAPRLFWRLAICAIATLIFLIRLHGATDLESYGQPASIAHLLDLMTQSHFFVQRDLDNAVMSVPPLHTWLMAPFAAVFGLNRVALTLPSYAAVLTTGLLVFEIGRRHLGELAAGLAAMVFLLSPATAKHVALVGSDPVFACAVTAAALACSSAPSNGKDEQRRWLLFALMSALATLTFGVLGLLLPAGGLLSRIWNVGFDSQRRTISRPCFAACALFVGIVLAWLIPAAFSQGVADAARMLALDVVRLDIAELLKPATYHLLRYLPFSLFLFPALWRVARHPAAEDGERRFERFLVTWLVFGFLAVSLSEQKGVDPVFPLWPAGALFAGREMARLAERMGRTKFAGVAVVIGCFLIGATYNAVHSVGSANLAASALGRELQLAGDAERAARALKASSINPATLNHLDTPKTLQLYLGTFRPLIARGQLEEILDATSEPVDLATGNTSLEALDLLERFPATKLTFRWPEDQSQPAVVQVYRIAR